MTDKQPPTITIHASLGGFPVDIAFAGSIEQLQTYVERLHKLGATPPPRPSYGGKPPARPVTQPRYDDDGTPCCTVHNKRNGRPLPIRFFEGRDGRPGFWGCVAKSDGTPGETINARGYCDLRFDLPAPTEATNGRR